MSRQLPPIQSDENGQRYYVIDGVMYFAAAPPAAEATEEPASKRHKSPSAAPPALATPTTSGTSNTTVSSPFSKPPSGEKLSDLQNVDLLLKWLRDRMKLKDKLVNRPNLLGSHEMQYTLQGRTDAMITSKNRLKQIFESTLEGTTSRTNYKLPVCSAMSGIGKSRLLDEWVKRFNTEENALGDGCELPPFERRCALVMSYGNGHSVKAVERSMGSEAGFAWRLLHAVFLDFNSDIGWKDFWSYLPENAKDLTLRGALNVIRRALEDLATRGGNNDECYALFVGIDEYQLVPKNVIEIEPERNPLSLLLQALVDEMTNNPPVVLLPMFAGTDWEKMSVAASSSSAGRGASAHTTRLSLPLLAPSQVSNAVLGRDGLEDLLKQEVFCRNLFFLGGVPRPCTEYAEECHTWRKDNQNPEASEEREALEGHFKRTFAQFFKGVYMKAPSEDGSDTRTGFTLRELIHLVAYSVRGGQVMEEETPFQKLADTGASSLGHLKFT